MSSRAPGRSVVNWRSRRSSRARASSSSSSAITSGGASRNRLPRVAKDTPCASASSTRCFSAGGIAARAPAASRVRAVGDQLDHGEQAVAAAHVADDRDAVACKLPQALRAVRAQRARALDQSFVLVGATRGQAGGAGQRMAAIGQAGVEHLVLETLRRLPPTAPPRPAAGARRSGPWRASSCPVGPASPWRCQANHSPQRPKPLITSSAIRQTPRARGVARAAPASSCRARRCHWCRRSAP